MWHRLMVMAAVGMMALGCGGSEREVRDRPEDCTQDQYFDEGRERCRSCPAVEEPECKQGCGLDVERDHLGCPYLICEVGCPGCEEGERWNAEEERCEFVDES